MSKDFEQAYREAAQTDAPDLWDRIEAGLKDKSVPEKKSGQKKRLVFKRYAGVLAAALCVAVILPAAVRMRQTSKGYSATDTTESIEEAAQESMEESAEAGAVDDMAADVDNGVDVEAAMDAGAAADMTAVIDTESETDREAAMDAGDAADMEAEMDAAASKDMAMLMEAESSKVSGNDKRSETAGAGMASDKRKDEDVFEHVDIKVIAVNENFYMEGETEPGLLCTVSLQQSMSGIPEGEQITIYVPSDFRTSFYKDGTFEVDLKYRDGADYSYELRKIYE